MDKKKDFSRRKFLQILGSVVAGGTLAGFAGAMFKKVSPGGFSTGTGGGNTARPQKPLASPYRMVSAFEVPGAIEGFEANAHGVIVATAGSVLVYDRSGGLVGNFAIRSRVRDLASDGKLLYVLFPDGVEVYDIGGMPVREWSACSGGSDYCSLTVVGESVFVTDAGNKNICKYSTQGAFVRVIESPDRFIIPSYSFGITHSGDAIYCSNPGRHRVESYTLDGEYSGSFGTAGGGEGMFAGCCNPVHLTISPAGEIITSEKGVPRVSCYGTDGRFRGVMLDGEALGSASAARRTGIVDDMLFVAGGNRVSVFRYDPLVAAATACGTCNAACPLRTGLTI